MLAAVHPRRVGPRGQGWPSGLLFFVVFADFTDEIAERLIHVDTLLSGRLNKSAPQMFGKVATLVHPDLALVLQVTLISDQDNWETILVLDSQDLLVERANFLEGVPGGDGVDEQEPLARAHVLFPHGAVFFLASGVKDIKKGNLIINHTLLSVRVLDGGIVLVHEVALDELDR